MKLPFTRALRSVNNPLADASTGASHYPTKFRDNQQFTGETLIFGFGLRARAILFPYCVRNSREDGVPRSVIAA